MFYKPKFCCECGDSIERTDRSLLIDRRFCPSCETDYKINTWFYRAFIVACVLIGVFGFGALLQKPEKPLNLASGNSTNTNKSQVNTQISNSVGAKSFAQISETNSSVAALPSSSPLNPPNGAQKQNSKTQKVENNASAPQEAVYYCGAETKKGTFCTHLVKGGGRCWQHASKPAMLPQEKLLVSQ